MTISRSTLKPHQQQLFDFLDGVPNLVVSTAKDGWFQALTNLNQDDLVRIWVDKPTFTTCNAVVGVCATKMGVGLFQSLDPKVAGSGSMSLGQFEIATVLAAHGMSHAWVANANDAKPSYGDVFRCEDYHMGVSLGVEGETFHSIEGGQGGFSSHCDKVECKHDLWGSRRILGWVDIGTLLGEKTSAPGWLGGWWRVRECGRDWSYYFDNDGCVYCQGDPPLSNLFAPAPMSCLGGRYSIVKNEFQTVQIRWFSDDPDETFQVTTSLAKVQGAANIRDARKDTMDGTTFGGAPMSGKRLPGPWRT